jgi:hypothetical protein
MKNLFRSNYEVSHNSEVIYEVKNLFLSKIRGFILKKKEDCTGKMTFHFEEVVIITR